MRAAPSAAASPISTPAGPRRTSPRRTSQPAGSAGIEVGAPGM